MLVYLLLLLTMLMGLRSLFLAGTAAGWPRRLLAVSMAVFIYLYGAWVYLSFYLKYAFGLLFAAVLLYGLVRNRRQLRTGGPRAGALVWSGVFLALSVLFFTGTNGRTEYVSLHFPLQHGDYFVLQGGKGLPANLFHYNARRAVYAMDIVRLNDYGQRCRRIFSKKLEDYYIFGDTVYSPCRGVVGRATDDNPDNIPPERRRGPHNLNGVLIESDSCYIFLGHLKQGGVFVHAGDAVEAGTPLGLAGNSGMSIEPHLHIQAHAKAHPGTPWYLEPQRFIRFDDKAYLLFEQIRARQSPRP